MRIFIHIYEVVECQYVFFYVSHLVQSPNSWPLISSVLKAMQVARWPNLNPNNASAEWAYTSVYSPFRNNSFVFNDNDPWPHWVASSPHMRLHGLFYYDWADDYLSISRIDLENSIGE